MRKETDDGFGLAKNDEKRCSELSGSQQWGGRSNLERRSTLERRKPTETTKLALINASSTPKKSVGNVGYSSRDSSESEGTCVVIDSDNTHLTGRGEEDDGMGPFEDPDHVQKRRKKEAKRVEKM